MNDWHQTAQPPTPRRRTSLRRVLMGVAVALIAWGIALGIVNWRDSAEQTRRQLVEIRVELIRQSIRDVDARPEVSSDWRYRQHHKLYSEIARVYTQAGYDDMADDSRQRAAMADAAIVRRAGR